jgi:hypothetical protein
VRIADTNASPRSGNEHSYSSFHDIQIKETHDPAAQPKKKRQFFRDHIENTEQIPCRPTQTPQTKKPDSYNLFTSRWSAFISNESGNAPNKPMNLAFSIHAPQSAHHGQLACRTERSILSMSK